MIITQHKPFLEICKRIAGDNKVFLVGCASCATICKTGGEDQILQMKETLEESGKTITGWAVIDPACNLLEIKRLYRKQNVEIDDADIILSFACGGGTQALLEIIKDKEVFPGNDTLFQGEITELSLRRARFEQKCSLCGECLLGETGALCPVTRCPKSLRNGPCGGTKNSKCEINKDLDCIWVLIYDRLKKFGRLDEMKKIQYPKDYSKTNSPRNLIVQ